MKVVIFGAGGHGTVVADILLARARAGEDMRVAGFLDDDTAKDRAGLMGLPVLGPLAAYENVERDAFILALGDNALRARWCERLKRRGERLATAIHPGAHVSPYAKVGEGCQICAGAVVNPYAEIGADTILNTGCSVDHHNRIGAHVHVAPGARLGGEVTVGEGTLIGIGATVMPGRRVGSWAVVGAGAVVTRDIADGSVAIGCPAGPRADAC